jgi:hypothetical protein
VVIADRVGWTGFWLGWLAGWLTGLAGWFGWQAINILTCLINFYRNQCVLEHIYKAL